VERLSGSKYVLLEWEDGWREVTPVDGDALAVSKYFVIERIEYFGRVVVERPGGEVPALVITDRKPLEVKNVILVGSSANGLQKSSEYREGGRVEHNYELVEGANDVAGALATELSEALLRRGVRPADVLASSIEERSEIIGGVAAELRLVASRNQSDLVHFVEGLLERSL
jgi:hypothetical protein